MTYNQCTSIDRGLMPYRISLHYQYNNSSTTNRSPPLPSGFCQGRCRNIVNNLCSTVQYDTGTVPTGKYQDVLPPRPRKLFPGSLWYKKEKLQTYSTSKLSSRYPIKVSIMHSCKPDTLLYSTLLCVPSSSPVR